MQHYRHVAASLAVLGVLGLLFIGSGSRLATLLGSSTEDVAEPGALELREVAFVNLGDSSPVAGGALSKAGQALVWTVGPVPRILLATPWDTRRLGESHLAYPIAGAFIGEDTLEIIDREARSVFRMSAHGRLLGSRRIAHAGILEAAARGRHGWFVIERPPSSDIRRVLRVDSTGATTVLVTLPAAVHADSAPQKTHHLATIGDSIAATMMLTPFVTTVVHHTGHIRGELDPLSSPDVQALMAESPRALWVASPLAALDTGYVQTFADLRSDRRLMIRYDETGRVRAAQQHQLPIGLMASEPDLRTALLARHLDQLEIVWYRWTWARREGDDARTMPP